MAKNEKILVQNQVKLNELYTRLQMIDQEIKQVQAQMQVTEQQMQELAGVKESLNDLSTVQDGNEILVPIAGGIFVCAKLSDPSELLINVGASVNVKKSIDDVIKMIDTQSTELEHSFLHMQTQFQVLFEEATSINEKISPMVT